MTPAPVPIGADVQVPVGFLGPMIFNFKLHALRVAIVERAIASRLTGDWECPAVYALLDPSDDDAAVVYVGKAKSARARIRQHATRPPIAWRRVVIVTRDSKDGFSTSDVGYLEGRLRSDLDLQPAVRIHSGKNDSDETLPDHLQLTLDQLIPTILAALRIAGLALHISSPKSAEVEGSTIAADTRSSTPSTRASATSVPGTVSDLVAAGLLSEGTRLIARSGGRVATAEVGPSGEIVMSGGTYPSPSSAASAGLGVSLNGWIIWRIAENESISLADLRAKL